MKNVEENNEKIFTKNKKKGIIGKKNDLFTANNKKYLQRKGLVMKNTEDVTLKKIENELKWKEKIIIRIFNKTFNKVANLVRINTVNQMIK
jgi:hypothetical protein